MRTAAKSQDQSATECTGVTVNVLGYREDGAWVALALEMDLRGYGDSFQAALAELADLIVMQISFAESKERPEMVFHPAEPVYFSLFAEVRADRLRMLAQSRDEADQEYQVGGIAMPPPHVIAQYRTNGFALDG